MCTTVSVGCTLRCDRISRIAPPMQYHPGGAGHRRAKSRALGSMHARCSSSSHSMCLHATPMGNIGATLNARPATMWANARAGSTLVCAAAMTSPSHAARPLRVPGHSEHVMCDGRKISGSSFTCTRGSRQGSPAHPFDLGRVADYVVRVDHLWAHAVAAAHTKREL
jgi:hypothetical protein